MQKIAIVIPCYNEEKRLQKRALEALILGCDAHLYLADDGSKDQTLNVITAFCDANPTRCSVIHYKQNSGKANTIYKAINEISQKHDYDWIGYFDADFSTPTQEVIRLIDETKIPGTTFILGSRILLLNSGIKRKFYRHIIGRTIITLINLKFKLGIYDTQCGAKIFSKAIIGHAFNKPFYTSWLFDVEVFIRLKKQDLLKGGKEVPIYKWVDVDGSKLGWQTMFKIGKELFLLHKNYKLRT